MKEWQYTLNTYSGYQHITCMMKLRAYIVTAGNHLQSISCQLIMQFKWLYQLSLILQLEDGIK